MEEVTSEVKESKKESKKKAEPVKETVEKVSLELPHVAFSSVFEFDKQKFAVVQELGGGYVSAIRVTSYKTIFPRELVVMPHPDLEDSKILEIKGESNESARQRVNL